MKKVDEFSKLIETIKEEEEQNKRQILKKIEEMDQRFENNLDSKVLDINRSILQSDKAV